MKKPDAEILEIPTERTLVEAHGFYIVRQPDGKIKIEVLDEKGEVYILYQDR